MKKKNRIISVLGKVRTPLSVTYNRAFAMLQEQEQKRAQTLAENIAAAVNKNHQLQLENPDEVIDGVAVPEEKPYQHPSTAEVLSTAEAMLAMEEFLDPLFNKVADVLRAYDGTAISVDLEASETEHNDNYPEQGTVCYHINASFQSHREEPELDGEGNKVMKLNKVVMVEVDQEDEIRHKLDEAFAPYHRGDEGIAFFQDTL